MRMKKINLMMLQGLMLSTLALGFASCEPDTPCPNRKGADPDTSQGVTVMLEMEDVVTGETTRTVLGESNYNFTPVNGGGDVEVYGLGFYRKQGQGDDIDVDLTYYAKENVVFQGWSWRYGDDPVGTAWGKKEGEKGYVSTPAIQAKSGVQKLELGKDATKFTCQYRPNADNTVYVKVKYVKVDPSKVIYHWEVGEPVSPTGYSPGNIDVAYLKPSFRNPKVIPVTSYATFPNLYSPAGELQKFPIAPIVRNVPSSGIDLVSWINPIPDTKINGRFFVYFLQKKSNTTDNTLEAKLRLEQPCIGFNGSNIANSDTRVQQYPPYPMDRSKARFKRIDNNPNSPYYKVAVRLGGQYTGQMLLLYAPDSQYAKRHFGSQILVRFTTEDGRKYDRIFKIGDENGNLKKRIDLLEYQVYYGQQSKSMEDVNWGRGKFEIITFFGSTKLYSAPYVPGHIGTDPYFGHDSTWFDFDEGVKTVKE